MATTPPGFGSCVQLLAITKEWLKDKKNMSARTSVATTFEPTAKQTKTIATNLKATQVIATHNQFREGLWHEYRLEGINAGFNPTQAIEYASALSPEMGLVGGLAEMEPTGRGWFYQSHVRVAKRTVSSGLIQVGRWRNSRTRKRTAGAAPHYSPSISVPGTQEGNNDFKRFAQEVRWAGLAAGVILSRLPRGSGNRHPSFDRWSGFLRNQSAPQGEAHESWDIVNV